MLALLLAARWAESAAPPGLARLLPQAQAAGSARLTWWGFPIYDATLWVGPSFRRQEMQDHVFALELKYLRALRGSDIAERSLVEMQRLEPLGDAQARAWLAELRRVLPDVEPGDTIIGVHRPGRGAAFLVNGRVAGEIADARFARAFFSIWLAAGTREPALRAALLEGTQP